MRRPTIICEIFKILYFLKMCPIFVSSFPNFGRSDNAYDITKKIMISTGWKFDFLPNSNNISWTDSTLEAEVMVGAEEPGGRLLPPAWWPACWLTGPLLNPLRTLELSPQTLVASDRQSGCPPPCCCCCCCCCEVTWDCWDWFWDWITWKSK